ncbi:MAG TPA: hypothetical protein VMB48_08160 [Steroidobacteraceae bacterium]|nr:hypothetical protein [Steroidobacteraceae bacterium]
MPRHTVPRAGRVRRKVGRSRSTSGRRRGRRWRLPLWPAARTRRLWARILRRSPAWLRLLILLALLALVWLAVNGVYQVLRKPTELFFPVSGALNRTPEETWYRYAPAFRRYATDVTTPEFLAALAQVEASGNPVARTYWRWTWKPHLFELYRPASSAVGMYQLTDGTFAQARRYCIRDHQVVAEGPWKDWHSCWLNGLYFRVVPSHAVELVSAYLTVNVHALLGPARAGRVPAQQRLDLATVIHLCGPGEGARFVARGLTLPPQQRCGDQDVHAYLVRVRAMERVFRRLAAAP